MATWTDIGDGSTYAVVKDAAGKIFSYIYRVAGTTTSGRWKLFVQIYDQADNGYQADYYTKANAKTAGDARITALGGEGGV